MLVRTIYIFMEIVAFESRTLSIILREIILKSLKAPILMQRTVNNIVRSRREREIEFVLVKKPECFGWRLGDVT